MTEFGSRLKQLRKSKKLTQRQLSELLGVAEITIRQYEAGLYSPKMEQLIKIVNYFEVTTDYLLDLPICKGCKKSFELSNVSSDDLINELRRRLEI